VDTYSAKNRGCLKEQNFGSESKMRKGTIEFEENGAVFIGNRLWTGDSFALQFFSYLRPVSRLKCVELHLHSPNASSWHGG
jgi:hypothetical protein